MLDCGPNHPTISMDGEWVIPAGLANPEYIQAWMERV